MLHLYGAFAFGCTNAAYLHFAWTRCYFTDYDATSSIRSSWGPIVIHHGHFHDFICLVQIPTVWNGYRRILFIIQVLFRHLCFPHNFAGNRPVRHPEVAADIGFSRPFGENINDIISLPLCGIIAIHVSAIKGLNCTFLTDLHGSDCRENTKRREIWMQKLLSGWPSAN